MATYFEGALDSLDTVPARTTRLAIKALFTGGTPPTGWSFVEDYDNGTAVWTVLKCSAAATAGSDFYVVVAHVTAGTGNLFIQVGEGYSTATHALTKPAITWGSSSTNSTYAPSADGSASVSVTPTTLTANNSYPAAASQLATTNPQTWAVFTWSDGILISYRGSTMSSVYAGNFTSLVYNAATNDPITIGLVGFGSGPSNLAGAWGSLCGSTRSAMNGNIGASHYFGYVPWHVTGTTVNTAATWDKYASDSPGAYFFPVLLLRGGAGGDTNANQAGYLRGKLDRVVLSYGASWGDTFTADGSTYQCHAIAVSTSSARLAAGGGGATAWTIKG